MTWRSRMPKEIPAAVSEADQQVMWSELEKIIMKVCKVNKLTDPQRDILDKDVEVIGRDMETTKFPAPNDMYDQSPLFRAFATEKAISMAQAGATAGKIVNAIANYIHLHGWIAYLEKNKPLDKIERPERSDKVKVAEAFE